MFNIRVKFETNFKNKKILSILQSLTAAKRKQSQLTDHYQPLTEFLPTIVEEIAGNLTVRQDTTRLQVSFNRNLVCRVASIIVIYINF